jgi:hypothetical protein
MIALRLDSLAVILGGGSGTVHISTTPSRHATILAVAEEFRPPLANGGGDAAYGLGKRNAKGSRGKPTRPKASGDDRPPARHHGGATTLRAASYSPAWDGGCRPPDGGERLHPRLSGDIARTSPRT